jgi:hypothetical protein
MLSNSVAAASLAACYVLILFLQLNPTLPIHPRKILPVAATIGLFYAVHLTALFYMTLVLWQLMSRELFSPAWLSIGVLAWLAAGASISGAVLIWSNVRTFGVVLEPQTTHAMTIGAAVLAGAAVAFALIALSRQAIGARTGWAGLLLIVAVSSVAAPLVARGRGTLAPLEARPVDVPLDLPAEARYPRVRIIAIDAGSLELVTTAAAEGRLANFGRILDAGAVMHLATLHPTAAEAVWAAVATGKLPQKNGIRSAGVYLPAGGGDPIRLLPDFCFANGVLRFGLLSERPHSSATIRARTLWRILSASGISSGVVNWPLTYPASPVRGYLVSDRYAQLALTPSGLDDPNLLYPAELAGEALPIVEGGEDGPVGWISPRYQMAARLDRLNDRLSDALAERRPAQVTITRFQSLDPIGHYFLRYAAPGRFGDVSEDERLRLGPVLESHYRLIDDAIGRAIAALGPDDLLLVVSAYGMEPLGFGKRLLERVIGDPDLSGTHEAAPDGFLLAYGASVAKGRLLRRASIVDVTPTVLYFLGLSVGRDMDGYVRSDLFQRSFTADRPITFIPTYER